MKFTKNSWLILVISFTAGLVFAGCSKEKAAPAGEAQKIRVAHTQNYFPYDFINEQGESDGFEVAVLKAVDALIPEYEFEFLGTSDDDLLIGVESGKYAVGIKGAWLTEERRQKFIIPEHFVGASVIGIAFRTENADQITDFESFARFSGKLVPIPPQSAQWPVVEDFNNKHPDTPVKLVPSDVFIISDAYTWVVEGRYDAFFDIKLSFDTTVKDPGGAWHSYADRLSYAPYRAIPTYPLINKNYPDLAAKYDAVFQTLVDDGTLKKLSRQYFGEDIFQYN
jgi:L-cystine transport system substrate-binding protein